jgi:hypothetical protein
VPGDGTFDKDQDVAVLELADPVPLGVAPALLRCPSPKSLVGTRWWALGFPSEQRRGSASEGSVGAALALGWVRIDVTSPYPLEQGFSGAGLWSSEFNAVVGILAACDGGRNGQALALTIYQADRCLPGHGLRELAEDSRANDSGEHEPRGEAILVAVSGEREESELPLAVKAAAAAIGAAAGVVGLDAAVVGVGLTPVIEEVLGRLYSGMTSRRGRRVAETLTDAVEELGGDAAEQLKRFAEAAASDETYQELLARTLTVAQDTALRDKRRALGRALANALDDTGTRVDDEMAFARMLADLDPVHIRVLKIMSRRPKHLDRIADQMNAADDPKAARQWYEWSILDADPGLEGRSTARCGCSSATA